MTDTTCALSASLTFETQPYEHETNVLSLFCRCLEDGLRAQHPSPSHRFEEEMWACINTLSLDSSEFWVRRCQFQWVLPHMLAFSSIILLKHNQAKSLDSKLAAFPGNYN